MQINRLTEAVTDARDAFNPEAGAPAGREWQRVSDQGGQPAVPAQASWLSIQDLVSRDIPIEWDEAVAVVEELCSLVTAGGRESPIPDLGGILITARGGVTLSAVGGESGASAAGRTLNTLLSSANVPVPLRLFVTQSTAPETYSSVRDFATALAYFSKPGRADLIRGLYEKGAAGLARSSSDSPGRKSGPNPATALPKQDTSRQARKRPAWAIPAFAAVAATSLLAVGIWLWSQATPGQTTGPSTLVAQATSVAQTLATGVRQTLGTAAPPRIDNVEPHGQPMPQTRTNRVASAIARPPEILEATKTQTPDKPAPEEEEMVSVILTDILPEPRAIRGAATEAEPPIIYSSADANVTPPTLLHTQLPAPIVINPGQSVLNTMEVVVSERGTVERVRLIAGPTRMPDMMLLSGAKTWQFTPAMKGDVPVRYRAILSWSSVP